MDIIETLLYSKQTDNNSVELIDCDWNDNLGLVLVLKENRNFIVQIRENRIELNNFNITCEYPLVRWIDYNRFLIADARNDSKKDNLYILNTNGSIFNSFNCGDAIEDIATSKKGIWISYFDEGVFGSGISTEGLVLFSYEGTPLFRYHTDLIDRPPIIDCYAICIGNSDSIWLFPYYDFPLISLNTTKRTIDSYEVPKILHGSNALCVRGKFAYFYDRYNSAGELYCWEIGKSRPQLIGKIKGSTRGLDTRESNHFISIEDSYVKAYRIINHNEYT
jgi:hypothetical protein